MRAYQVEGVGVTEPTLHAVSLTVCDGRGPRESPNVCGRDGSATCAYCAILLRMVPPIFPDEEGRPLPTYPCPGPGTHLDGPSVRPILASVIGRRAFATTVAGGFAIAALVGACVSAPPAKGGAPTFTPAEFTALARQAYIYTLPLYVMYRTRYGALENSGSPNRFTHARRLATPATRTVTAPNNDTLYSSAWLDLAPGPLLLHVPDAAGRYYSLAFMDFYTNNFAYVGRRTTGTRAGDFAIVGPRWQGDTPAGTPVIRSPTNAVWLLGRFLVNGDEDLPAVHALQDQLSLRPLAGAAPSRGYGTTPRPDPADPWSYLAAVNAALTENPPPARDRQMVEAIAQIGLGPNVSFDAARFSAEQRAALLAGLAAGKREVETAVTPMTGGKGDWARPRADLGNFGTDYFFRAIVAQVGLAALEPQEAAYLHPTGDAAGRPLDGSHRYLLHFLKGALPPVDAFWSLTMYRVDPDQRRFLVANPINRYSIGDRTKGLVYNADGSLDLYIQHGSPGAAKASNWLPAPAGPFVLSLRAYQPRPELLSGGYRVPALERQD